MQDPTQHVCCPVARDSEHNEKRRLIEIVLKTCRQFNKASETELNQACEYVLDYENPLV